MSNSGQLRTLALNENRIRSDSDPTAGRMKSISRAGSIDTGRKKTQRQASITQFIYKDPKLNLENACSTPEKHVSDSLTKWSSKKMVDKFYHRIELLSSPEFKLTSLWTLSLDQKQ